MEKRFVAFLLASLAVMLAYNLLVQTFVPPPQPPVAEEPVDGQQADEAADDQQAAVDQQTERQPTEPAPGQPPAGEADQPEPAPVTAEPRPVPDSIPARWFALGSLDPTAPYRMMVVLTNQGAAVQTVTFNSPHYLELLDSTMFLSGTGYLGGLVLSTVPARDGCRVEVVGPGTPAAKARLVTGGPAPDAPVGLQGPEYVADDQGHVTLQTPGDLITAIDGTPIPSVDDYQLFMTTTRPGQVIELTVRRGGEGQEQTLTFSALLTRRPLEVLNQEPRRYVEGQRRHPPSFLLSLSQVDDTAKSESDEEILDLPSLRHGTWQATSVDTPEGPAVEFRRMLTEDDLAAIGQTGRLEIIKRYRLAVVPQEEADNTAYGAYHLEFEVEIRNLSEQDRQVAYQLDGPTGLTEEGWWYSYKPGGSGARDVVWATEEGGFEIFGCRKIVKQAVEAMEASRAPNWHLFTADPPPAMKCAGTDSQFFAAVFLRPPQAAGDLEDFRFRSAVARPVAGIHPDEDVRYQLTDVTCRLTSRTEVIPAGETLRQRFQIYIGPKRPDILRQYRLEDLIVYGWFGAISKILLAILHFFHDVVRNYGLAIILLTVLVRACMFPISRKMALNAQRMQELAPEMKKIRDKYKNDMEKQSQAQRDLYRKHNFNPFGGCLLMFLQLPIFIGLYRGLSVDVLLRQEPLIPGIWWCSNLAGPDKLMYWQHMLPGFLAHPTGWLGPYLNVLPLVTCVLFLVQQKMFSPPATDEQQKMQQQVMQFMMLFMAVLFFKVASGLCVYFIASSMWGLGERLLLPKTSPPSESQPSPAPVKAATDNGASRPAKLTKTAKAAKRKRKPRR